MNIIYREPSYDAVVMVNEKAFLLKSVNNYKFWLKRTIQNICNIPLCKLNTGRKLE